MTQETPSNEEPSPFELHQQNVAPRRAEMEQTVAGVTSQPWFKDIARDVLIKARQQFPRLGVGE